MKGFFVGGALAAWLFGAMGCGDVGTLAADARPVPLVPMDASIDVPGTPPVDGAPIDGPPIDGAPIDGPPIDGPPVVATRFDVAYINEYTLRWNNAGAGLLGFMAVANTGSTTLDLSRVSVVRVLDNNIEIDSRVTLFSSSTAMLAPGQAAGELGPGVFQLFDNANLLPEPITDDTLLFAMSFPNQNIGFVNKPFEAEATIRIEDTEIVLPFTVHFVASDGMPSIQSVARLRSR
jgi:hypothetical protein